MGKKEYRIEEEPLAIRYARALGYAQGQLECLENGINVILRKSARVWARETLLGIQGVMEGVAIEDLEEYRRELAKEALGEQPEYPADPTGVDCWERYEGIED